MATETELRVEKAAAHEVEDKLGVDALVQAKHASDQEHSQTFLQALKANKKAAMWSAAISMSIVMEGYDTILMARMISNLRSRSNRGRATFLASQNFRRNSANTMVKRSVGRSLRHGKQA